jgi:hypothetical protein
MTGLDPVLVKARSLTFHYDDDIDARREIERRLAGVGRRGEVITYSDLVKGIVFRLTNVNGGAPFQLGAPEWIDLHRAIIGGCLGRIACDSYERGRFLASALAVSRSSWEPSDGFRALLEELGLVASKRDNHCLDVWLDQLKKAHAWLAVNRSWPDA